MFIGSVKRRILAFIIASLVAVASTCAYMSFSSNKEDESFVFAATLSELQSRQQEIKKQQQQVAARLSQLKNDQSQAQAYKETLDQQMASLQEEINVIVERIAVLDENILQTEIKIAGKRVEIDNKFEELKGYLKAIYLTGEASSLELLLGAENIADFTENLKTIEAISNYEKGLIDDLKAAIDSISDEQAQILDNKNEVVEAKKELDQKQTELKALQDEAAAALAKIRASVSEAQSQSSRLEGDLKKADAAIDKWYQDYYAAQRAAQQAASSSGAKPTVVYQGTGSFTWPCPGVTVITSYWGDGRNHKAIDIAGSGAYGKAIVASDGGTVIGANYSGWGGGYGLYVMIDHGNGYSTMYAHASKVIVSVGQNVNKGQTIAYIGSTGDSSGPHLHFEVRKNGTKINPLQFFSR